MTIWPARVPVRVEDWPEQSSATANITLARLVPSSGASSTYACLISVTMTPFLKNTAAAITRIAAFTSSAPFRAMTESIRLYLQAVRFSGSVWPMLPGLHQGRVQVQVVRHHRRAQDPDDDVKRLAR